MKRIHMLSAAALFPALVLAGHWIASRGLGLYERFPRLDVPFHFIGGVSIGYTTARILSFLQAEDRVRPLEVPIRRALVFTAAAAAAALWELLEFGLDQTLGTNAQVSLSNTMQDQLLGILGGLLMAVVAGRRPD